MAQHNYIIYDIETSGLRPEEGAEVVQISAMALNYWDLEEHHAGKINLVLKPQSPETASPKAIEVIGEELWTNAQENGLDPKIALEKFVSWAASVNDSGGFKTRPWLVGYNNKGFDNDFILYWLKKYGVLKVNSRGYLDQPWSIFGFDVMDQYMALFEDDPRLNNFKLDSVAALLSMARSGDTHDAMEDVEITAAMFKRFMTFMRKMRKQLRID